MKYDLGRLKEDMWVLGGVERPTPINPFKDVLINFGTSGCCLYQSCAEALGCSRTIICSDAFAGYSNLEEIGYYHFDVNHKQNCVDTLAHAHSQRIEGL